MATRSSFLTIWRPFCFSRRANPHGTSHAFKHSDTSKSALCLRETALGKSQRQNPKDLSIILRHQGVLSCTAQSQRASETIKRAGNNGPCCIAIRTPPTTPKAKATPQSDKAWPIQLNTRLKSTRTRSPPASGEGAERETDAF